jgi:hypothetical protein
MNPPYYYYLLLNTLPHPRRGYEVSSITGKGVRGKEFFRVGAVLTPGERSRV